MYHQMKKSFLNVGKILICKLNYSYFYSYSQIYLFQFNYLINLQFIVFPFAIYICCVFIVYINLPNELEDNK